MVHRKLSLVLQASTADPGSTRADVGTVAGLRKAAERWQLKPGNVIVQGKVDEPAAPRAVVMDFGLARALDRSAVMPPEEGLSPRWGTVDYTAPEVAPDGAPTVLSDIYAFGKVAAMLLPDERIWGECLREDPKDRPQSMDAITRRIQPDSSRRYWLGGLVILSAGVAAEVLRTPGNPGGPLPAGARVLVNGFRAAVGQLPGAQLVRAMVLTALRQSPRIQAIPDEDLLPALRRIASSATLPVSGVALSGLIAQFRPGFWIEGDLRQSRDLYSADVRLMRPNAREPVASMVFQDTAGVNALAHSVARWIRQMAGESAQSLALNPADVASYTSRVPEALEKYYDAMEYYALGEMRQSIPLFYEAVNLDSQFAQAHYMLALTIRSTREYEESFRRIETAMGLIGKLPQRERINIEAHYYRMTEDPVKAVEAGQRNVAYHPGEPAVHGSLGQTQMTIGQAAEGAESLRRAVALAPGDWLYLLPLEDSLVEAAQFQQALDEYKAGLSRGVRNPWIHNGAAAYLGLERYDEARRAYESEPADASNSADVQSAGIMQ
jgi:hypothetical protein